MLNRKMKAFTLAELLVTLALTAILITLAYSGLSYIQRLLKQYNEQSFFITQITELEKRIGQQTLLAREIKSEKEQELVFRSDSGSVILFFDPKYILLKKNNQTDSFLIENSGLQLAFEKLSNDRVQLINALAFDLDFRKQKFHCIFRKNYDGFSKFILESKDGNN